MRKFLFKHMMWSFLLGIGFGLVAGLVFQLAQKQQAYEMERR